MWRLLTSVIAIAWAMYPGSARSAIHPEAQLLDPVAWSVDLGLAMRQGWVPPFRGAQRDRSMTNLGGSWRPSETVELDASWGWLSDTRMAGDPISGPGDVRLGFTTEHRFGGLELAGGWSVKLPNAQDEGELGSDETDVQLIGTIGHRWEKLAVRASAGMDIRGDPIRFANQDDVAQVWLSTVGRVGPLDISGNLGGDLATVRSPARLSSQAGLRWGERFHVGAFGGTGLTPAAADWNAMVQLGWSGVKSPD